MAKQQFNKLMWLVDVIYRRGQTSFAEINFRDCFGIIRDETLQAQRILLCSTAVQALYLRNLLLHSSQREVASDGTTVDFELFLSPTYDFRQELLSKGSRIEVLQPQTLRDAIRAEIEEMQKQYRS